MYIALRPFKYRGRKFEAGEEVPAETWPSRKALVARRRIKQMAPDPTTVAKSTVKAMKRAELNRHAAAMGITDPEEYANRRELLLALYPEDADMVDDQEAPVDDENEDAVDGEVDSIEEADDSEEGSSPDESDDEDSDGEDSEEDGDGDDETD